MFSRDSKAHFTRDSKQYQVRESTLNRDSKVVRTTLRESNFHDCGNVPEPANIFQESPTAHFKSPVTPNLIKAASGINVL